MQKNYSEYGSTEQEQYQFHRRENEFIDLLAWRTLPLGRSWYRLTRRMNLYLHRTLENSL